MNEAPQFRLRIAQRLLARYASWTTRHLAGICLHRRNEGADAVVSGHNNEIAVGARQQLNHFSDIASRIGRAVAVPWRKMDAAR
jgi:hypothetical protein